MAEVRRYAPGGDASPVRLKAWRDFLNEWGPGDEIWNYHTCYNDYLAASLGKSANGWDGFVLVRQGEIVASYDL